MRPRRNSWRRLPQLPGAKRLLTFASLTDKLGYSRYHIYRLLKEDATFPRPVRPLGPKSDPRWKEEEIDAWIDSLGNEPEPDAVEGVGGETSRRDGPGVRRRAPFPSALDDVRP